MMRVGLKAKDLKLADIFEKLPESRFAENISDGPGLSLSYSGLKADEIMNRLEVEEDKIECADPDRPVRRVGLKDPVNGLSVAIEYTLYQEHNAILYGAVIKNNGNENIEHLTALCSYDLTFSPLQALGNPGIHTVGGGVWNDYYPTSAFKLQEYRMLGPTGSVSIDSGPSGRSSNKDLPFFFVEDGDSSSGIYGGIEWSGMWHIDFTRRDEHDEYWMHYGHLGPNKFLDIKGGMDGVNLQLRTGEVFHMPRVLLGFYKGSIKEGRNCLRRFINDWSPKVSSGKTMPAIQGTPGGYIQSIEHTYDEVCRKNAAAMADIGVEYYVIEQWYKSMEGKSLRMMGCRGNWTPDAKRFPDMKGFAEYIRSLGMGFGLWTDIEVVNAQSDVAKKHPEWILYLENTYSEGLLNFALPQVQEWAIDCYDFLINEYGLEWIFYDNNINPNPFWEAHEPSLRKGRLQHDFVRGWWRVWEEVSKRHPDVIFENCSSGGRRIDLGTLCRSHCSFTCDQFRFPDIIRYQFSGANTVIPGNRIINGLCQGLDEYPDVSYHSRFGGVFCISEGLESWTEAEKKKARKHFDVYKSIRRLLSKDFYPLFTQPQTLREWDGWQFNDVENNEGFVLVFRANSTKETVSPQLYGLRPDKEYIINNPYTNSQEKYTGKHLMQQGLRFSLKTGDSCLIVYS